MDLISREAVIKAMENNSFMVDVFGAKRKMIDGMMMCIEIADLPTIDAVPVVKAEWVANDSGTYFCSECDSEAYWDTDYGQQLFDWCPYCGADMRKGGSNE